MTGAVAKSSSLATMNWLMSAHLIGGIDNVGRVEQIYVEAKEPFWKKKMINFLYPMGDFIL